MVTSLEFGRVCVDWTQPDTLLQGFGLVERERDQDGYVSVWESAESQQRLPLLGLELVHRDGAALTRIASGEVIEAYRNVGLGRVAVSVLRERHRWLTSGEEATYTAYWARLMSRLGRPAPRPDFASSMICVTKKHRSGWPKRSPRTFCCVDVNKAPASEDEEGDIIKIPNLGIMVPDLGMSTYRLIL